MQAKAVLRGIRISPIKVRLVCDVVRGMPVNKALSTLQYMPQKAAVEVARIIKSAAANAEHNYDMERGSLVVKTIYADEGPTTKRLMFRARGRADRIDRKTTHITVVVDDGEEI